MPRLILQLGAGARTADVRASVAALPQVQDAVATTVGNAVIVSVPEVTSQTRQELLNQPGVENVFDDIQAFPQVADAQEREDFLERVRDLRGEENVPLPIETEPTGEGDPIPDGGASILPVPQGEIPAEATAEGPITDIDAAVEYAGATALHEQGITGESVIAVVVDTGSCADSFRSERQLSGTDLSGDGDDPWTPLAGHGGMTMGIMAGDDHTPGIDVGFLPGADLYPIKTTLAASELMQAQDIIVSLAENNPEKTVVCNNSWGFPQCTGLCDHPVTGALDAASRRAGVSQVIAAGNEGGTSPTACGAECDGSTVGISGPNSLESTITVGATGLNGVPTEIQPYSSRGGPGSISCGSHKPDVSAPVFGRMPYGCSSRDMGNEGGTSAACPEVAGGVGLIADARGRVTTNTVTHGITETASPVITEGFNGCAGAGNIQIDAAVESTPAGGAGGLPPARADLGSTVGVVGAALGVSALAGAALRHRFGR